MVYVKDCSSGVAGYEEHSVFSIGTCMFLVGHTSRRFPVEQVGRYSAYSSWM